MRIFFIAAVVIFEILYKMFRNSIHNLARNQIALSSSRITGTVNFSARVYYSDLWCCYNSPGSDKCQEFLRLVCRCLGHVYNCINRLLLRLHKVTCLLLRQKPAGRNDLNLLPDVLKDVGTIKRVSPGPDVIPFHEESRTINQESVGGSVIMTTVHSSHQLNIGGYKNHYNLSHLCYCNSNIHSHEYTEDNITDITFRPHSNGHGSTENSDVMYCQDTAYGSTRDRSRVTHSPVGTDFPRQTPHTNQFKLSGRFTNHKSNGNNEYNQGVIIPNLQTGHIQSNSYKNDTEGMNNEDSRTQTTGHQPHKCDSEITREIVLALRRVGDNLDTRLRYENKKSLLAMMGASNISDSWFTFLTLGQRSTFGAMVCLSLELLHQFNRL